MIFFAFAIDEGRERRQKNNRRCFADGFASLSVCAHGIGAAGRVFPSVSSVGVTLDGVRLFGMTDERFVLIERLG